jgi:acetyl-CoA carboxylase carboxyltransferase component
MAKVGNIMYGMQSMSSDVPEVCVAFGASCIAGQLQAN